MSAWFVVGQYEWDSLLWRCHCGQVYFEGKRYGLQPLRLLGCWMLGWDTDRQCGLYPIQFLWEGHCPPDWTFWCPSREGFSFPISCRLFLPGSMQVCASFTSPSVQFVPCQYKGKKKSYSMPLLSEHDWATDLRNIGLVEDCSCLRLKETRNQHPQHVFFIRTRLPLNTQLGWLMFGGFGG